MIDTKEVILKSESECNDADRIVRAIEREKCKASFLYFLGFCKVVEAPTLENSGGVIPLTLWEHLKKAAAALLTKKLIVWLKSRQIGASWLIAAYCLWYAMHKEGASILLFSKGETEAFELLAKCRRIYLQLPDFMRLKVQPDSDGVMGFPIMMSTIKAFAATKTAGISFTASVMVCDEWDEHPFAEQNYFSSKPCRDAGGQFIGIFTASNPDPDTLAKVIFQDARKGKNEFTWLFDSYDVRPGRDGEWYEKTKNSIPEKELGFLTPELYMLKNYPRSVEEALSMPQTVSAFNVPTIMTMMQDTKSAIKVDGDYDSNIIKIYKPFSLGEYFVAASDTSHGVGKDYSVTILMNVKTGEISADIMNNSLSPEEFTYHSVNLLRLYKDPLWLIEDNDWGAVVISSAQKLNYKNIYTDGKKYGFHTGTNRTDLWGKVIPAINNRQIVIYNINGLRQFLDVIRNTEKGGRIEAVGGRNDDYPMAVAIAWFNKDKVNAGQFKCEPIKTLTFSRGNRWLIRR